MRYSFSETTFRPHVGEVFTIRFTDATVELRLAEVVVSAAPAGAPESGRVPFTLYFVGPADIVLPQRIYAFEHPTLRIVPIFIVPLGPTPGGMRYEAIFN